MNMEKTTTKKTAKYYRDIISKKSVHSALVILPEVINKYGSVYGGKKYIPVKGFTEFEWNHKIEGFSVAKNGQVLVDIYWQGDSTDGNTYEYASDLIYGKVIPAEWDEIGGEYGMQERHSPIRISKEEFEAAIKAVAQYLSPEEIKARKIIDRRHKTMEKVFNYIDEKKKGLDRWEMEGFWNGRIAVQKLLEMDNGLADKPWEEIQPVVEKVFTNNNKSDYTLRGGYYDGEKKYNLAY